MLQTLINLLFKLKIIFLFFNLKLINIKMPLKYGKSKASFVLSLITIKEIAKVNLSVAILVDILIVILIKKLGIKKQKKTI